MAAPQIEHYNFGRIRIDGQEYSKDVIVFPDHVEADWWREQGHSLVMDDLETVLRDAPGTLVIGRGAYSRMQVPEETREALERAGVEVLSASTSEAVKLYNDMRERGDVVAALHLTC